MARPRKVINLQQLDELSKIGCTHAEMGAVLGVSTDTIGRRYAERIKTGREHGKSSLRHAQWQKALGGNVAMLIWLGKQELGQTDKPIEDTTTAPDVAHQVRDALRQMMAADGIDA